MFVVVDMNTRCLVPGKQRDMYVTRPAAQAAVTRIMNKQGAHSKLTLEVMDMPTYRAQVPMREVTNLMTGETVWEPADLPWSCSVGSETYWSS
jgi:hypothetical protein